MSAWRLAAYRAIRPLLFRSDPERVHEAALSALRLAGRSGPGRVLCSFASGASPSDARRAPIELMGLRFRNRIGLAAGFDKDGVAIRGWAALGFGSIELGTVTPRPQPGNLRPRLFRIAHDGALINRMGFNNLGADALAARIAAARNSLPPGFVIGVNIGRNRDGDASDFPEAARAVADLADYLVVNVSSPNTPGLRDLQDPDRLLSILAAVKEAAPRAPLLAKLSPDLDEPRFDDLIGALVSSPAVGVVLSNTTTMRAGLPSSGAGEAGGVSGRPLLSRTLDRVTRARTTAGNRLVIVASGGIGSASETDAVLRAGADLVQLWSGLIYAGPGFIGEAVAGRSERAQVR